MTKLDFKNVNFVHTATTRGLTVVTHHLSRSLYPLSRLAIWLVFTTRTEIPIIPSHRYCRGYTLAQKKKKKLNRSDVNSLEHCSSQPYGDLNGSYNCSVYLLSTCFRTTQRQASSNITQGNALAAVLTQ